MSVGRAALIIAAVSFAALAGAWGFELIGRYLPCPLCLEERIPYYVAIPGGILSAYLIAIAPRVSALVLALVCAGLLYNAGLGIYHAGAEWHFWPGPSTCSGGSVQVGSLAKSLHHNEAIRCDEAALRILGVSLAGYSVLISAGLAALGLFALWRQRAWLI